ITAVEEPLRRGSALLVGEELDVRDLRYAEAVAEDEILADVGQVVEELRGVERDDVDHEVRDADEKVLEDVQRLLDPADRVEQRARLNRPSGIQKSGQRERARHVRGAP